MVSLDPCERCRHYQAGVGECAGYVTCATSALDVDLSARPYDGNDHPRTMQRRDAQDRLKAVWIRRDAALSCEDPSTAQESSFKAPTDPTHAARQARYRKRQRATSTLRPCAICGTLTATLVCSRAHGAEYARRCKGRSLSRVQARRPSVGSWGLTGGVGAVGESAPRDCRSERSP